MGERAKGTLHSDEATADASTDASEMPLWRWVLLLLVGLAIGLGFYVRAAESCETSSDASDRVVRTCRPLAATDPPVVVGGALLVLLALPLFSEVTILGVSWKRRVAQNEQQIERTTETQGHLVDRVNRIEITYAPEADSAEILSDLSEPTVRQVGSRLESRISAYIAGAEQGEEPEREPPGSIQLTDDEAAAQFELIRRWEQINHYVPVGRSMTSMAGRTPLITDPSERERFVRLFAEELDVVRRARNSVAHAAPIDRTLVDEAISIADQLLEVLGRRSD